MHRIHYMEHELARNPRMRIWTTQQAAYGQFEVITHEEFVTLQRILTPMGYEFFENQ